MRRMLAVSILAMLVATLSMVACQKKEDPKATPAQAVQKPVTSKAAEPKVPETPIKLGGH